MELKKKILKVIDSCNMEAIEHHHFQELTDKLSLLCQQEIENAFIAARKLEPGYTSGGFGYTYPSLSHYLTQLNIKP